MSQQKERCIAPGDCCVEMLQLLLEQSVCIALKFQRADTACLSIRDLIDVA